jgi:hypothetical protein
MEDGNWRHYAHWHQLFDELCNGAGYYDTAALAFAYCALTASKGERQFDTAVRNLNNWRSGRHLPRTKNLRLLARLLKVSENPDLQRHWNTLYKQAGEIEPAETAGGLPSVVAARTIDTDHEMARPQAWVPVLRWQPYPSGPARKRFSALEMAAGGAAMLIVGVVAGSLVTASGWRPWAGPADNAPIVPFRPKVTMKVGETRPIYAERATAENCRANGCLSKPTCLTCERARSRTEGWRAATASSARGSRRPGQSSSTPRKRASRSSRYRAISSR